MRVQDKLKYYDTNLGQSLQIIMDILRVRGPGRELGISLRIRMRVWDKFKDHYLHFKNTRTIMRSRNKFKDRRCNLLRGNIITLITDFSCLDIDMVYDTSIKTYYLSKIICYKITFMRDYCNDLAWEMTKIHSTHWVHRTC